MAHLDYVKQRNLRATVIIAAIMFRVGADGRMTARKSFGRAGAKETISVLDRTRSGRSIGRVSFSCNAKCR